MSLARLMTDAVTVLNAGTKAGDYGGQVPDWDHPTSATTKGWLWQESGTEVTVNRDTQTSDWRLVTPPDAPIGGDSRILCRGITFEVVGRPVPEQAPTGGRNAHLRVNLRLVTG